jgi:hypothetical protein
VLEDPFAPDGISRTSWPPRGTGDDPTLWTQLATVEASNPAYTGTLMAFLGFGVAIGNWISLITLLAFGCIPHVVRVVVEERALAARFGQAYAEYRRKTWSLIPFIW